MSISTAFTEVADYTARASGRPAVFAMVAVSTLVWLVAGPVFGFSDTWQLIANTSTNIITFLMVFVIQNSQNRDTAAIQAKLDELIRATEGHAALVGVEEHTQEEIERIKAERNQTQMICAPFERAGLQRAQRVPHNTFQNKPACKEQS